MENINNNKREREEKSENTQEELKKTENEKILRITASREAQNAVKEITDRINDGFVGGKVNQTQMTNWAILKLQKELDDVLIREIRAEHFDEVAMLESVLRQAKESGKVPVDFKALLQKQLGLDDAPKKKVAKSLTKRDINDVINSEAKE